MAAKSTKSRKKSTKRTVAQNKSVKSAVLKATTKKKKSNSSTKVVNNKSVKSILATVPSSEIKEPVKSETVNTEKVTIKKTPKKQNDDIKLPKQVKGNGRSRRGSTVKKSDIKKKVNSRTKTSTPKKNALETHLAIIPAKDEQIDTVKEDILETKEVIEPVAAPLLPASTSENIIVDTTSQQNEEKDNKENFLTKTLKIKTPEQKLDEVFEIEKNKKKRNWPCIIFSSVLITTFIILVFSLIVVKIFNWQTILFVSLLLGFLVLVASSYNKYLSGKIFTMVLLTGMGCAIYYFQYTYDFIHELNTKDYEKRTYYVVALDTNLNRSIYNLNGKKIGMLKENSTNVRRVLNTTLDSVTYLYYEDSSALFEDFYGQKIRAIIVGENYYKYLANNEMVSNKKIKVLHEFQANARK